MRKSRKRAIDSGFQFKYRAGITSMILRVEDFSLLLISIDILSEETSCFSLEIN